MVVMVQRFVIASLFVAATAYAQAPGEVAPEAAPAQPAPAVWCPPHESVMANRWAVGLSVGSVGLTPKDQDDPEAQFGVGELSLRFRATLHLEIEAAFGGGREQLRDGNVGERQVTTGVLALRYRFAPEQAWNWWVMGGLGSLAVTYQDATDQQRNNAMRPLGEFGVGIERRFRRFAIQAELRALGVGVRKDQDTTVMPSKGIAATTMPPPGATATDPNAGELQGGQLTIGASYYF